MMAPPTPKVEATTPAAKAAKLHFNLFFKCKSESEIYPKQMYLSLFLIDFQRLKSLIIAATIPNTKLNDKITQYKAEHY